MTLGEAFKLAVAMAKRARAGILPVLFPEQMSIVEPVAIPDTPPKPLRLTPTAPLPSGLFFDLPSVGPIRSGFGMRDHPIHGDRRFHHGLDIAAREGTPVEAVAPGLVVHAGPKGSFGLLVIVDHGSNFTTYYAHLSAVTASVGERVDRGEIVGAVGRTGDAKGAHLHFEVRHKNKAVDPRGLH